MLIVKPLEKYKHRKHQNAKFSKQHVLHIQLQVKLWTKSTYHFRAIICIQNNTNSLISTPVLIKPSDVAYRQDIFPMCHIIVIMHSFHFHSHFKYFYLLYSITAYKRIFYNTERFYEVSFLNLHTHYI